MRNLVLLALGFFLLAFQFPKDHGFHPESKLEWCYFVGHLQTGDGKRFGYELSFFRVRLNSKTELYPVHFAISDFQSKTHHSYQESHRSELGIVQWQNGNLQAGDFSFSSSGGNNFEIIAKPRNSKFSLTLHLSTNRPVFYQGNKGLSPKSRKNPSIYSNYYSVPRLESKGILELNSQTYPIVSGLSWMDHEWSGFGKDSASLSERENSWDWVCLQMEDGTDIVAFRFRENPDSPYENFANWRDAKGKEESFLTEGSVFLEPKGKEWVSPVSKIIYPMEWSLKLGGREFFVTPVFEAQEFDGRSTTGLFYWEGAVTATTKDGVKGIGYLELKGRKPKASKGWFPF